MPGKAKAQGTPNMPKLLAAHVHDLLMLTGFAKTAKKFEGEYGEELADIDRGNAPTLMELYCDHIYTGELDSDQKANAEAPKKEKKAKKAKGAQEEDNEDEAPSRKKRAQEPEEEPEKKKKSKKSKKSETTEEDVLVEEAEEKPAKKGTKSKRDETPVDDEDEATGTGSSKSGKGGKGNKAGNVPFQRIKSDEVTYLKVRGGEVEAQRLLDNTFESKFKDKYADGEVREDYGAKASAILAAVRGKDFRHEKTKKKRGTYKGGPIDMASNSIKFVNSDDEDE